MNAICVGLLENYTSSIQSSSTFLSTDKSTVQDVMPLVLHSIELFNLSAYNYTALRIHQQTITFYTFYIRV